MDTNVWLETLLEQESADQAEAFLSTVPGGQLSLTEFSLYSIGIILTQLGKDELFDEFMTDTVDHGGVGRLRLDRRGLGAVLEAREAYDLDFDDAYQYAAARSSGLELVSFDDDFDPTDLPRLEPRAALERFKEEA